MLDLDLLQATLTEAASHGGEFAEAFFEDRRSVSGFFDDQKVEEVTSGRSRGVGVAGGCR